MRRLATLALLIAAPRAAIAAEPLASGEPVPGSVPDYVVERVELRGNGRTDDEVLLRHVPYRRGDRLVPTDAELQLVRYRLLSTGFFSRADLRLERGSERGQVVLVVEVVERNTLVVENLWVGVAADEGDEGGAEPISPFLGLRIAERNLLGSGVTLGGGIGLADDQISLRADFADPTFLGGDWAATATLLYVDGRDFFGARDVVFESPLSVDRRLERYAVVPFQRVGGQIGTGRDLTLTTAFALALRLEHVEATPPLVASHDHGGRREPVEFHVLPGRSMLSGLEASILHDTRDAPFLVTRGALVQGRLTLGLPPLGSDYGFARVEGLAQRWFPLPLGHVLKVQGFVGAIAGDAPFFEQYYVGDFTDLLPDRVLELAPDRRKAPNLFGTAIGLSRFGEIAAKLDLEYRVPLYEGRGSILGVDAFAGAGLYALTTRHAIEEPAPDFDGLAAVPIDLTYNVGLRIDTSVGGATLAFSNLLGLLPARGSDP